MLKVHLSPDFFALPGQVGTCSKLLSNCPRKTDDTKSGFGKPHPYTRVVVAVISRNY